MNINQIMVRCPINRTAGIVTSQRNISEAEVELSSTELNEIKNRLIRKLMLMKIVLSIKNKAQHKNAVTKYRDKSPGGIRQRANKRIFSEYVRVCDSLHLISCELQQKNKIKKEQWAFELYARDLQSIAA